jgi:L-2-hydroxyglutarate oxidase LhgO
MDHVDVIIIGAEIIGLAVATELSNKERDMFVLEKDLAYGQGTSSRNSEVIHTHAQPAVQLSVLW